MRTPLEELERMDLLLLIEVAWRMLWPAGIAPEDFGAAAELALIAQARESSRVKKSGGSGGPPFTVDGRARETRSVPTSRAAGRSPPPAQLSSRRSARRKKDRL
jgi:hypothetical protein